MKKDSHSANKTALGIALVYSVIAAGWIFFSDTLVHELSPVGLHRTLNTAKGWLFVLFTAVLLFYVLKSVFKRLDTAHESEMEIEKQWRFAMNVAGDGLWDWNLDKNEFNYFGAWTHAIGIDGVHYTDTDSWLGAVHPDDIAQLRSDIKAHIHGHTESFENQHRLKLLNGEYKWHLARGLGTDHDKEGIAQRFSGVITDISAQKKVENELRVAASVFESNEAKMITDSRKVIIRINQAFSDITGYTETEVLGKHPSILKSGNHSHEFYQKMWDKIREFGWWQGEIWNKRKNGEIYPEWLKINVVKDDQGNITNYIASFNDISAIKKAEKQIQDLAYYDGLTHLPNKTYLVEHLEKVLASPKPGGRYSALLFVDIKNFKALNNTLGYQAGDYVLIEISKRLNEKLVKGASLARYGSDIFSIVLEGISNTTVQAAFDIHSFAYKLKETLEQPITIADLKYEPDVRLGISIFESARHSVQDILKFSEIATHEAKTSKEKPIHFFDQSMQEKLEKRFYIQSKLKAAIPDHLFLTCQLQFDTRGEAVGAEVLIRWNDPEMGLISPMDFIPVAEESGLINRIGEWVLKTSCQYLQKWSTHPRLKDLTLAINVSLPQFMQENFTSQLADIIAAADIAPTKLKLELTESVFVENFELIIAKMNAIKALGVKLSLDDFGTGFSSLSYLKRLPIDELKIDQSFVKDLENSTHDEAIVKSIIALGKSMDMKVIAEGVEQTHQREILTALGCDKFQGYLFDKPKKIEEFEKMFDVN